MQSKISIMQFVKIINWELREVHCPAALNRPSQVADDLHPIWHTAPSCCTHTTPMEARDRQDVAHCASFFCRFVVTVVCSVQSLSLSPASLAPFGRSSWVEMTMSA